MSIKWLTDNLYVAHSLIDNVGIFCQKPLRRGDVIYRVTGTLVQNSFSIEFAKMGPNWIGISKELWIDPHPDNPMTFMNHSCEPNAIVGNDLNVIALHDIPANIEILMDYSTTEIDPYWQMACKCHSSTCRTTIKAFQFLPVALRELYAPQMLPSLIADVQAAPSVR